MQINGSVEQYKHITMLRTIDNLILFKMIEEYTKEPIDPDLHYYYEYQEFSGGYYYDDLWYGLEIFIDFTIGEAEVVNDSLRINLHSMESIIDHECEELEEYIDTIFKELQSLKCTVWNEDGFIYLYLEDFDFENHLIAEQLLKLDKFCLELGEKL